MIPHAGAIVSRFSDLNGKAVPTELIGHADR
jgi:hypothetical protein